MIARRLVLVVFCSLAGVLALASAPAFAQAPVLTARFGVSDLLERAQAVEVDQASGDVYVVDENHFSGASSIAVFDASGSPVSFTAKGSYISANRLTGTPTEEFSFHSKGQAQVAVDNSSGPLKGDLYVTDTRHNLVDVFASSGEYIGQLNGSGTPQSSFGEPCGVVVDGSGRVYVGDGSGYVERYTPIASTAPIADVDYTVSEISGVTQPCAVAVDPAGDVFENRASGEFQPMGPLNEYARTQFPASGSALGEPRTIVSASKAVAVDPSNGHVYVDEGTQVSEYQTAGENPELIEIISSGVLSGESYGIAVHDTNGVPTVYVSDQGPSDESSASTVYVYGTPPTVPPAVVSESTANVTAGSADIDGQVNPDFADTTYCFEYDTSAYTTNEQHGTRVPLIEKDIGSAGGPLGVQSASPVHLTGLQPGTTYHYRIVAKNMYGTTSGADASFTTQPAASASTLLDERAYELVSPPEKEGVQILTIDAQPASKMGGPIESEAEGNSVTYIASGAIENPVSNSLVDQYVATRDTGSWANANITPVTVDQAEGALGNGEPYVAFSSDLSRSLIRLEMRRPEEPTLDPHAPAGYQNFVLHSGLKGAGQGNFEAALTGPIAESSSQFAVEFEGATPDLTHVVFSSNEALTPDAVVGGSGERNVYEWTPGDSAHPLQLVNILPGEEKGTPGAQFGGFYTSGAAGTSAISDGGSRIFFTSLAGGENNLYLREFGKQTVQVDAAHGGPESGHGEFSAASSDGSRVFFVDRNRLTENAGGGEHAPNPDLYMFEVAGRKLTDIAPHGNVQGVLGASKDGSYVYFVADGVLAPGASPGLCALNTYELGWRTCNLYVWHNGTTKFIAKLSEADNRLADRSQEGRETVFWAQDWSSYIASLTARVSPDGRHLVFMSNGDLTGYDSRNAQTGQREQEVYAYAASSESAPSGVLTCVSCDPTGAKPQGSSSIPAGTAIRNDFAIYQSRVISSDANGRARVFFESANPLVPQDTNGTQDVYEWEEDGLGTCHQAHGCLGLVSSGTNSEESLFLDASANGNDVFFLTKAQLAPRDTDELLDVYDARSPHVPGEAVGSPAAVPVPPPCSNGDSCKGPVSPQPAIYGAPASATFTGAAVPVAQPAGPSAKVKAKKTHRKKKRSRGRARTHSKRARVVKKSMSRRTGR